MKWRIVYLALILSPGFVIGLGISLALWAAGMR